MTNEIRYTKNICNLVSGGAGFLGSHLIDSLIKQKEKVICLDNYLSGQISNIEKWIGHPNFEIIKHDVTEPIELDKKIDSRETYFKNLAKQLLLLEDLYVKIDRAWKSIESASNQTQRKRSVTRFKKYESELAPIFKKCCLKLKVFEDFLTQIGPELKAITRNVNNLALLLKRRPKNLKTK